MSKKVAIVHEMLVKLWWAEKVVQQWMDIFPDADIFTLIYDEKKVGNIFPKDKVHPQVFKLPSQKRYKLFKNQRLCLTKMPLSVEQLDLSKYDTVLVSSSWFAHWVITKPETKTVVYYHAPARYMWDWTNEYKNDIGWKSGIKWFIINSLFLKLRQWDIIASNRCDIAIANAKNTQNRLWKYYRKKSDLLYPPVEVSRFQKNIWPRKNNFFQWENYYLVLSALTEFKKIDIAVENFNNIPENNLLIVWAGDYRKELEKKVTGKNIVFAWAQYGDDLVDIVQNCQWLIFPGEEDFWIVPIEVMAAWKPVFAFWKWGLTETVIAWKTWDFFNDENGKDFIEKFKIFNENNLIWVYSQQECQKQAEWFSSENFEKKLKSYL